MVITLMSNGGCVAQGVHLVLSHDSNLDYIRQFVLCTMSTLAMPRRINMIDRMMDVLKLNNVACYVEVFKH